MLYGGDALMDEDGRFVAWHREFKASQGKSKSAPSISGNSRVWPKV